MLIDTDVIIWYMRGNPKALKALEKHKGFTISVVTYMELVQGMRNKKTGITNKDGSLLGQVPRSL